MEPEEALKVMRHYITRVRDLDHISPESLNNSEQLEERHIDSVPIYHTHSANLRGELDQMKRQQAAPEEAKEDGAARANVPDNIQPQLIQLPQLVPGQIESGNIARKPSSDGSPA